MRVFSDFHHDSLWKSLEYLFEKRLGWELYCPKGLEWFYEGYWKVAEPYQNCLGTVGQYLGTRGKEPDANGIYQVDGMKGITLEKFKEMNIDIIIASIPAHLPTFTKLINEFKPKAKLIFQIGNEFGPIDFTLAKNILSSTSRFEVPRGINVVFYHQEFDLDVFNYEPPVKSNLIRSFVHTLPTAGHFQRDWQDFLALEKAMPEMKFESYGASCRDGCIDTTKEIARLMKSSLFGFNLKTGGDGFGHIIHNWFAVGRPVIVRKHQYEGKLAGGLMIDGETCIDLDKRTLEGNAKRIRQFIQDEQEYDKTCQKIRQTFETVVNYDKEFEEIKQFLERLK